MSSEKTITINASCHCRGFTASYTLPVSALPLKGAICSCTSCRRVTGQLFGMFVVMPVAERPSGPTLQAYAFSDRLTSNFCNVCGATIANFEPDEWEFASGILSIPHAGATGDERREGKGAGIAGLIDRQCLFVADTRDGGGAVWLPPRNSAGREMKQHAEHRTSAQADAQAMARAFAARAPAPAADDTDRLHGRCKCGRVRVFITRPDPRTPPDPRPGKGRWWLADAADAHARRYLGKLDACDSCRLATGVEVNAWVFVPPGNAFVDDGGAAARPFAPATDAALHLARYSSSAGAWRSFCRTCGATVAFWDEKRAAQVLDFGAGLFAGEDGDGAAGPGARREDWFEWKGLEFAGDAMDRPFVDEVVARAGRGGHP